MQVTLGGWEVKGSHRFLACGGIPVIKLRDLSEYSKKGRGEYNINNRGKFIVWYGYFDSRINDFRLGLKWDVRRRQVSPSIEGP